MTHFLLATLVACALHAGLPLLFAVQKRLVLIAANSTSGTAVQGVEAADAPLPLDGRRRAMSNADGRGRA